MTFNRVINSMLWSVLFTLFASGVMAQSTGVISGNVVDGISQRPLPGAAVKLQSSPLSTDTDRSGEFQLLRVPTGPQTINISYIGYEVGSFQVEVRAGQNVKLEATLKPLAQIKEYVEVHSDPQVDGQARALNQQKTSPNIVNVVSSDQIGSFPDPNAAEATQRIPGIVIQRDQGEGRFVSVRGTEPRLNSVAINGERIPAPEGDIRYVALDVIPADLLEAIEVSKALTPDMDSDAIGGAVNLVTKQAPARTIFSLTAGLGYNDIVRNGLQTFNAAAGRRFFNNKLGALVSTSFFNTKRGSQNFETEYDDGELDTLETRDYRLTRRRFGINPVFDWKQSSTTEFFLRGIYNRYSDDEFRRFFTNAVGDNALERNLRDRFEVQEIISGAFGGRHLINNILHTDFRVTYSYAEEAEPKNITSTFVQEDVDFAPNVSPTQIDPNNIQANPLNEDLSQYVLDEQTRENNITNDREVTAAVNFALPLRTLSTFSGVLKFGGKYRDRKKARNNEVLEIETEDDLFLSNVLDPNYRVRKFLDGRYNPGNAFVNPQVARDLTSQFPVEIEKNIEEDLADFVAKEKISAGYVMAELMLGERFMLLPGLRFEHTSNNYQSSQLLFDDEGDLAGITPITGRKDYNFFMPALHARYQLGANTNLRAAITRTLSRPNFVDVVPFQLILEEDSEIERGNPDLNPTKSVNFDVLAEHYFNTVGVASAGFFYKRLTDNIFLSRFEEDRNGDTFDITQPLNGERASLWGIELAFSNQLRFLPKAFDGLGVYTNYTFTESSARIAGRNDGPLPGQAKHSGNFAVFYEKFGFSGRLAFNYHGQYIEEVGEDVTRDLFFDSHGQWDLSLSQRINRWLRVYVDVLNLTNEPLRRFEGFKNRPVQEEYYRWWLTAGIKIHF
jgi:TonB-dependent receptor